MVEITDGNKKRDNSQFQARAFNNFLLMEEPLLYMYIAGSSHLLFSIFSSCLNTNFFTLICCYNTTKYNTKLNTFINCSFNFSGFLLPQNSLKSLDMFVLVGQCPKRILYCLFGFFFLS